MNDLFGSTGAELAQTGARQLHPAIGNRRTGALALTSAPVAQTGAAGFLQPDVRRGADRRNPDKETRREAALRACNQAYADLESANAELATATAEQDPFEAAFQAAHQTLLHADRTALTKPQLFALYDARMNAGHAWNPHRKRMRDATQWRGTVLRDLQAINLEIGE